MATTIGKICVFLNLALSLFCAGLALGIYTNRINWSGPLKSAPGKATQTLFEQGKDDLAKQEKAVGVATTDWRQEHRHLVVLEEQRPINLKWYADQLAQMESGPVTALKYDAKGMIELQRVNDARSPLMNDPEAWLPVLEQSNLQGRTKLLGEIRQTNTQIDDEIAATARYLGQEAQLTAEIKNERERILEEQAAQDRAAAEMKFLRPLLYNRQMEAQLLAERKASLEARLGELRTGTGVAATRP